jgi:transcriptional regulator with XRE-family HTH domain
MKHIGSLIEQRRLLLGMSRVDLARAAGVSPQTVLNVERDPTYNLSRTLLSALGSALGVEFTVHMVERAAMNERIVLGNDELILHIRKHYSCAYQNPYLGRRIWEWIEAHADGRQLDGRHIAPWAGQGAAVSSTGLPGSGVHFDLRLDALPGLYRFLRQLATSDEAED